MELIIIIELFIYIIIKLIIIYMKRHITIIFKYIIYRVYFMDVFISFLCIKYIYFILYIIIYW